MDLIYLVGAPGCGKSALMAELTRLCDRVPQLKPPAHEVLVRRGVIVGAELGLRRDSFSGTDALPMNIAPRAASWMRGGYYPLVLGEGQRLGNSGFLSASRDAGYRVHLIYMHAPEEVLAQRRNARGSKQNCSWLKGAATAAKNLMTAEQAQASYESHRTDGRSAVISLDATHSLAELARQLCEQVPALVKVRT